MAEKITARETVVCTGPPTGRILTGLDDSTLESDLPHLYDFVKNKHTSCRAAVDIVKFYDGRGPSFEDSNQASRQIIQRPPPDAPHRHPLLSAAEAAVVFIIEDLDLYLLDYLQSHIGNHRDVFLRFLNEYLDDTPNFYFHGIKDHLQPLRSVTKHYLHVKVVTNSVRELDQAVPVGIQALQLAAAQGRWRRWSTFGMMEPCQRREFGNSTKFPSILITRHNFGAWFDADKDGKWQLGVILVDRQPTLPSHVNVGLAPPLYHGVLGLPAAATSYRASIASLMRQELEKRIGRPPPAFIVHSMFAVFAAEWVVINTYMTRDVNAIHRKLEGDKDDGLESVADIRDNLALLHERRRRINRWLVFVDKQRELCESGGLPSWRCAPGESANEPEYAGMSEDLIADYDHIRAVMSNNLERVSENISHVNALLLALQSNLNAQEATRGVEQNKMVLLLAVVATFFIPISTLSTILSMNGEWAPQGAKFWQFWAVSIPLSLLLVSLLLIYRVWTSWSRFWDGYKDVIAIFVK